MGKVTKEAALLYHSQGKPGKIEILLILMILYIFIA